MATCKAKYSRVREGDDFPSKEHVDNVEADILSETVVTESVSLNNSMPRAPSPQVLILRKSQSRRLLPKLITWRKRQWQWKLLQGETPQRRTRGPLRHRLCLRLR